MLRYLSVATGFASRCLLALTVLLLLSAAFASVSADAAVKPFCLGNCGPSAQGPNGGWTCTGRCLTNLCTCTIVFIIDPNTGQVTGANCPCD